MQTHLLIAHPANPPSGEVSMEFSYSVKTGWLRLRYRVSSEVPLRIPAFAGKGRADELWRTTCFELFVSQGQGDGYFEFNLSPSERWAAYDFTDYREGMRERPAERDPVCTIRTAGGVVVFDAEIPLSALPDLPAKFGACAVIEQEDGTKSFWAMAHGGDKPDFHDPACFAAMLEAPENL